MKSATMNSLLILGSLALVIMISSSCNKEKDTIAIITIVDSANHVVSGAYVKLKGTPTPGWPGDPTRLDQEMMTDALGQAKFDYSSLYHQGQAGFAVMDIITFKDSATGEGIIKIIEEETNHETVMLIPL